MCLPPLGGRREARRRAGARPGDLPGCRRGSLRIIAASTQESVITRLLHHLQRASLPPPIAPARCRQALFALDASTTRGVVAEATCAQQRGISPLGALKSPVKSSPPDRPSRGPRPGQPLCPPPHASSAACPDRAPPRYVAHEQRPPTEAGGGSGGATKWLCISYPRKRADPFETAQPPKQALCDNADRFPSCFTREKTADYARAHAEFIEQLGCYDAVIGRGLVIGYAHKRKSNFQRETNPMLLAFAQRFVALKKEACPGWAALPKEYKDELRAAAAR